MLQAACDLLFFSLLRLDATENRTQMKFWSIKRWNKENDTKVPTFVELQFGKNFRSVLQEVEKNYLFVLEFVNFPHLSFKVFNRF